MFVACLCVCVCVVVFVCLFVCVRCCLFVLKSVSCSMYVAARGRPESSFGHSLISLLVICWCRPRDQQIFNDVVCVKLCCVLVFCVFLVLCCLCVLFVVVCVYV